ncbi:SGNH/GDSL hydrolase family protein [Litorihabitans aurantiacus]|uniref:SGNH hydrolase n=1 Tax=Litorihabitans aurantiacus TaxID=1930061 RepID=A0AA37UJJ4_9MICO|nr:SGNH/GDSL hydrolase family protein [Litorihabitans aurantiacus]GMA30340.1 SGNH hydrolase [Litorihabitans aurantiacus]
MDRHAPWSSYLALGDSFTEGLWDVVDDDGAPSPDLSAWATAHPHDPGVAHLRLRGWADVLAAHLADRRPDGESLHYANLAIRGRLLPAVVAEQVPIALEMKPDLVSLVAGGNDILRPAVDIDAIAHTLEEAVVALRGAGTDVLLATGVNSHGAAIISSTRSRVGVFNSHVWSIARRHGAHVLDVWGMRSLADWRMWSADRIHLVADGHARVAQAALVGLGLEPDDAAWDDPLTPLDPLPARERLAADGAWLREHAYPWATRRLRRRSSGDARVPKQPDLELVTRST